MATVGLLGLAVAAPARAEVELTPGSAAVTATVGGLNIPYGGANLGIEVGRGDASYFERTAKADALTFDPAFLRIADVLKVCGGGFGLDLPEPLRADTNAAGGPSAAHRAAGPGVGEEDVAAAPGSSSRASVTGAALGLPGIVELVGGSSVARTELDQEGQRRRAEGEVRTGTLRLLGGLVELEGLRWQVAQEVVGPDSRTEQRSTTADFTVGGIRLAGVLLPTSSGAELRSSLQAVNALTGPFGLQVRLPEAVANGTAGVELTPLVVALGGDTVYGPALYPLLAGGGGLSLIDLFNRITQPALVDPTTCASVGGALAASPELNQLVTTLGVYAPIILSAFAAALNGGAELDLLVGGVRTTVDATYYPPRSRPAPPAAPVPTVGAAAPTSPAPAAAAPVPAAPAAGTTPVVVRTTCRTTSPVGSPGCSKGRAPLAATAGAVVTGGLLLGDELRRRRRALAPAAPTPEVTP